MEVDLNKPLEEKNIVEKHTNPKKEFKIGSALLDLERRNKELQDRVTGLEEAMQFFSEWYNKTQRSNLILPEETKITLLGTKSIMD